MAQPPPISYNRPTQRPKHALRLNARPEEYERADPTNFKNKVICGYQAWFLCRGDGPQVLPQWSFYKWGLGLDGTNRTNVDTYPDMTLYDEDEKYRASGMRFPDGRESEWFSSRNPKTTDKHFSWMAQAQIDGVALQRFIEYTEDGRIKLWRDQLNDIVRRAAEKWGRVWFIEYDIAHGGKEDCPERLLNDLKFLIHEQRIFDSPMYLTDEGRPVIGIFGLTLNSKINGAASAKLIDDLHAMGIYVFLGSGGNWRTNPQLQNDAGYKACLEKIDCMSPWTIGGYRNAKEAEFICEQEQIKDAEEVHARGKRYMPVCWPGTSWWNSHKDRYNNVPRMGGRLLWQQLWQAKAKTGADNIFIAMWDEHDESTAIMPIEPLTYQLPIIATQDKNHEHVKMIALDVDGDVVPSDWYLRITARASLYIKGRGEMSQTIEEDWKILEDWDFGPNVHQAPPPPTPVRPCGPPQVPMDSYPGQQQQVPQQGYQQGYQQPYYPHQQQPYQYQQGPPPPQASPAQARPPSHALPSQASAALDKHFGAKNRRKVEEGVETLQQGFGKLWGKFSK